MAPHLQLATAEAAPAPRIRVVLADDRALTRRCLRLLLDGEAGIEVVAEGRDIRAAVQHVRGHLPHVLILDLGLADGTRLEAIRQLRSRAPDTEIVVLSLIDDPVFAAQALEAGALGYVLKEHADSELGEAVRAAAAGRTFVSPRLNARITRLRHANGLSLRELEVLRLVALGYTSRQVARRLHLSARTVETYRARAQRKLGLRTRADLVGYALANGLLAQTTD